MVLDASVLVSALVDRSTDGEWATGVMDREDLVAPEVLLPEAANVLRKLESAGRLETPDATAAARSLLQLGIQLVPYAPFATRVWELRANLTAYDAWYVAVAEGFRLPLATLDRRLSAAPGPECEFLTP